MEYCTSDGQPLKREYQHSFQNFEKVLPYLLDTFISFIVKLLLDLRCQNSQSALTITASACLCVYHQAEDFCNFKLQHKCHQYLQN